jgi:hypothetical protein
MVVTSNLIKRRYSLCPPFASPSCFSLKSRSRCLDSSSSDSRIFHIMKDGTSASHFRLLENPPRKSFHDSDTASFPDEACFHEEKYPLVYRSGWKRRVITTLLVTMAVAYICGSLAFMSMMYRRGEHHLRAPDPPYSVFYLCLGDMLNLGTDR